MQPKLTILSGIPLFSNLPPADLKHIAAIAVDKWYAKGRTIFLEGDQGLGFYVVAAGRVKIFKVSADGKEQILHIYGAGHPFGEVPVFSGESFPANAEALAESHLLYFPKAAFVDLISRYPSLCLNMLAVLSKRLRQFTLQVENLSLKEVPGRLASYLLYLAEEAENPAVVELPISKGQLASLLGTIPETLSRIFARMRDSGLIAVDGRRVVLLDMAGLEALGQSGRL